MHDGQIILGNRGSTSQNDGHMPIATVSQPVVCAPSIGHDLRARFYRRLNKPDQRFRRPIRRDIETNTTGITAISARGGTADLWLAATDFHGGDHECLVMDASAFATGLAAHICLVNFDMILRVAADPVPVRPHHAGPQFVEDLEGGFVSAQPELLLELDCRHARRVGCNQICTPKPNAQRRVRPLHHGSGSQGIVLAAFPAPEHAGTSLKPKRLAGFAAPHTGEAAAPADRLQVGGAGQIIWEQSLELRERCRKRQIISVEGWHKCQTIRARTRCSNFRDRARMPCSNSRATITTVGSFSLLASIKPAMNSAAPSIPSRRPAARAASSARRIVSARPTWAASSSARRIAPAIRLVNAFTLKAGGV